jgi:hypothetical protein
LEEDFLHPKNWISAKREMKIEYIKGLIELLRIDEFDVPLKTPTSAKVYLPMDERELLHLNVQIAYEACDKNKSLAAKMVGVDPKTIYNRVTPHRVSGER